MIKNIIFDIGDVLVKFRWQELLQEDLGITGEVFERVADATVRNSKMWGEFDRSLLEDKVIIENCIQKAPEYEKEILSLFANIKDIVKEYPYAEEWIKELKAQGFHVYLLSNYGKTSFEACTKELSFTSLVDGAVISYEVKKVKPEPEIYETLLTKYSLKPEECVFFDDRPENVEAAVRFGIHGIVFQSKEQAEEELQRQIKSAER